MIEIQVVYHFENNEKRDAFYKRACEEGIIATSKAEEGNIKYDYFLPMDQDNTIFLLEQWRDLETLKAHAAAEHYARLQGFKSEMVASTDIIKYMDVK